MEIRVSPAVTVVVLIVVGAILVGLYYMVMAQPGTRIEAGMVGPAPESVPPTPTVEPASTTAAEPAGDAKDAPVEKRGAASHQPKAAPAPETRQEAPPAS